MTASTLFRRAIVATAMLLAPLTAQAETKFKRVPLQYIAALAAPDATSGTGAQDWGIWTVDPGPRGVRLASYPKLKRDGGTAPAGWTFDSADWWVEENGLIMEQPDFPLPAGQYIVTGDREAVSVLTVHPTDSSGNAAWELADGATIYDVTHLRCRAARYTPAKAGGACTPANVPRDVFPMPPKNAMPEVEGCAKQDYAVLFIVGVAVED